MKNIIFIVLCLIFPFCAQASGGFDAWLQGVRADALRMGVSESILNSALREVRPIDRVIALDRKQPEGTMTFQKYKDRVINQRRIDDGRALYTQHRALLNKVSEKYGVPPQYIVALWGIETSYGDNTGGFGVIPALATLAHDGRRSSYFRKELMNALKILDEGHISLAQMKGSWAGAMGQNQFMPSSFHAYAVDGNGDGRRDIWTTLPDVFASSANYLAQNGWKAGQTWGRAVRVPASLPEGMRGRDTKKTLQVWAKLGVVSEDGSPLPAGQNMQASLIQPDGKNGPSYLVYDNYRVIMRWNKSVYFATSVGLLADYIAR